MLTSRIVVIMDANVVFQILDHIPAGTCLVVKVLVYSVSQFPVAMMFQRRREHRYRSTRKADQLEQTGLFREEDLERQALKWSALDRG